MKPDHLSLQACFACAGLCAALASTPANASDDGGLSAESDSRQWWRDLDLTVPGAISEWRVYAQDGLRIDHGDLKLKVNASVFVDSGDIRANSPLETAFPGLPDQTTRLTRARLTLRGWLLDHGEFKFQMEFAQKPQIKDMWFRFVPLPYVGRLQLGNMKEPVSLESLTSSSNLTFLSRALPTLALSPGRNIGIALSNTALDERVTWAIGTFWNTASFDDFDGAKDALSESISRNLSARLTGLPHDGGDGRSLVHLGLSLSSQSYHDDARLRAVPETDLTTDELVDTGKFRPDRALLVNPEFAWLSGPWSFQAEYFHNAFRLENGGRSRLSGAYGFASYLLTGESRRYDRGAGIFDGVRPTRKFDWGAGGWGAWEVALRLSYVDLSDGVLKGGRQKGITGGLNWYLDEKMRLMLNYGVTRVDGRGHAPAVDGGRTNIVQARFAIDF